MRIARCASPRLFRWQYIRSSTHTNVRLSSSLPYTTAEYEEAHKRSIDESSRDEFWNEAAKSVTWFKGYDKVLDSQDPPFYKWFPGGELNACYNALDRHVENGRGDQIAVVHDSPVTETVTNITYKEMLEQVTRFAGILSDKGVQKGDSVIIYMSMVPEALVAMLACARLGAVHSVVFGGFAASELAVRIDDSAAKVVVAASCGIEPMRVIAYKPLVDEALELSKHKPETIVVVQRPQEEATIRTDQPWGEFDYAALMQQAAEAEDGGLGTECVPVGSNDPVYILYTSGTTGAPKGVVRDTAGHCVALSWSMENFMGTAPGEVYWAASDIGWVVGHSYIVYGPLFGGCTTVLYEGKPVGTPDAGAFWRVVEQHKVTTMFTAPTALRAIRRLDPSLSLAEKYDRSSLKRLWVAGERADPATIEYFSDSLDIPVLDNWWQTETGWPICGNAQAYGLLETTPGSCSKPNVGYDVVVMDEQGAPVEERNFHGPLAVRLPLPPGCFPTLHNNEQRYVESYMSEFPGFYAAGDAGFIDENGYVHVMARTDDVINVAAHRFETGRLEEILMQVPGVAECCVIGIADELKVPVGFLVLGASLNAAESASLAEAAPAAAIEAIREQLGAVASFKQAVVVSQLPKTRSGKILRSMMVKIAEGKEYLVPGTIEDMGSIKVVTDAMKSLGYPS